MTGPAKSTSAKDKVTDEAAPESPCVGLCELDQAGKCLGCFRMIDEIAAWGELDEGQRQAVRVRIRIRRKRAEQS